MSICAHCIRKRLREKRKDRRKCIECGKIKEVYAYEEKEWEEVKDKIPRTDLLIDGNKPLQNDDIVGVPICKECYECMILC